MSYTTALLLGIGRDLDTNSLGKFRESGKFLPADNRAIVLGEIQKEPPNQIAVDDYLTRESVEDNEVSTFIQFRIRIKGSLLEAKALNDDIRDLYHRRANFALGQVQLRLVVRRGITRLTDDGNGRIQHTQNFEFIGPRWMNPMNPPSGD